MLGNSGNTPSVRSLAIVLVLFAIAQVSFSQQCTPETCPDAPVYVEFQNSNCSGAREYYAVAAEGLGWGQCQSSEDYSTVSYYTDTYLASASYNSPDCGKGSKYPWKDVTYNYFGACFEPGTDFANLNPKLKINRPFETKRNGGGPRSFMYLRNAKKPFSPQDPIPYKQNPLYGGQTIPCKSYQECASKGFYFTESFNNGCNTAADSFTYTNVTLNTCYISLMGYQQFSCSDKHTIQFTVSRNADCSQPFMASLMGGECQANVLGTTYCTSEGSYDHTRTLQKVGL